MNEHEKQAYELGVEHAKAAASWVTDGNSTHAHIVTTLRRLVDGDPAVYDCLPARPNLSGEWADAPTPTSLYEQIVGRDHADAEAEAGLGYETVVGNVIDRLADAYEAGVADTFEAECERQLRQAIA